MKKAETKFKERVLSRLSSYRQKGVWWLKTQEKTTRGVPDILICAKGQFIAWELKDEDKLQELQIWTLKWIAKSGGVAREVTPKTLEEAFEELDSLIEFKDNWERSFVSER